MNLQSVPRFWRSTTFRLAGSYLLIIMALSIGFSSVLYQTSSRELARQVPPQSFFDDHGGRTNNGPDYHQYFQDRIDESRGALIGKLVALNVVVLALGAALSYYLARRTLTPIETAMESQSRFVTDASHELRTPLTVVLASNEVALRKPNLTLGQAKTLIGSNIEEMTKLRDLTEGLLSLAKQDTVSAVREPTSLQDIGNDAMNRVLGAAQAKGISIEDKVANVSLTGDKQALAQAVAILLDNAIKYSPADSMIYLEGSQKNNRAFIGVRDQGAGISPVDIPHIFDRFYRADESRTKSDTPGYGIGLSIAKKIIEQHGGTITASGTPGEGAHFLIELPLE